MSSRSAQAAEDQNDAVNSPVVAPNRPDWKTPVYEFRPPLFERVLRHWLSMTCAAQCCGQMSGSERNISGNCSLKVERILGGGRGAWVVAR